MELKINEDVDPLIVVHFYFEGNKYYVMSRWAYEEWINNNFLPTDAMMEHDREVNMEFRNHEEGGASLLRNVMYFGRHWVVKGWL